MGLSLHDGGIKYCLKLINQEMRGFPGGAVVKNLPANAGDTGSRPGSERSQHAVQQLSPCATTTEPVCHNY